jgi:hypothetical protein
MSNVTANMIGIPHRPLYFNFLNSNFKNYRNTVFLSFDFTCFNINDLSCDNLYNTFMFSLGLFEVSKLILSYYFMVLTYCLWPLLQNSFFTNQSCFLTLL